MCRYSAISLSSGSYYFQKSSTIRFHPIRVRSSPCRKMLYCDPDEILLQLTMASNHVVWTTFMVMVFVGCKRFCDKLRRQHARVTAFVIGAGPIGLTSALVAARASHVRKVIVYEEMCRNSLVNKQHQVALNAKSVAFLRKLEVDFDNMEGCWEKECFFTRIGIFQDYLLSLLSRRSHVEFKLGQKFTRETIREVEATCGRVVVLACDGASGQAARLLGLSDEICQHSCNAYCAVAALERREERQVPMPEIRATNVLFDLSAYGAAEGEEDSEPGFTVKLFGNTRFRYMTLLIPKCESKVLKIMRVVLNRSMMRNIFFKCFNTFRHPSERELGETEILKHMKFSPRLFEIKLSQRLETVGYFQDSDTFIVAEGETARCFNFQTGMDVNIAMLGLQSLAHFITLATWARSDHEILRAMTFKAQSSDHMCKYLLKRGLRDYFFV